MKKIIKVYPEETQTSTALIIEEIMKRTEFGDTKTRGLVKELGEKKILSSINKKKSWGAGAPFKYYYLTKPKKVIINELETNKIKKVR